MPTCAQGDSIPSANIIELPSETIETNERTLGDAVRAAVENCGMGSHALSVMTQLEPETIESILVPGARASFLIASIMAAGMGKRLTVSIEDA